MGKRQKLSLDIRVSRKPLGRHLALMMQEAGKTTGVEVTLNVKDFNEHLLDIRKRDFDIYAGAITQADALEDFTHSFHSSSDVYSGTNFFSFSNPRADSLMEMIKVEFDPEIRNEYYKEFQAILYEEQPVMFLFYLVGTMISSRDFEPFFTGKRPGFVLQWFKPDGTQ